MVERPPWLRGVIEGGRESPQQIIEDLPALAVAEDPATLLESTKELISFTDRLHAALGRKTLVSEKSIADVVDGLYEQHSFSELYEDLYDSLSDFRD